MFYLFLSVKYFSEKNEDNNCSICYKEFFEEEKITELFICNHIYHPECIKNWLLNWKPICPNCKRCVRNDIYNVKKEKVI